VISCRKVWENQARPNCHEPF